MCGFSIILEEFDLRGIKFERNYDLLNSKGHGFFNQKVIFIKNKRKWKMESPTHARRT